MRHALECQLKGIERKLKVVVWLIVFEEKREVSI